MDRAKFVTTSTFLSVVLTSCSGGGGSPPQSAPTPPPVVTRSFPFPAGDAVATKGTAWDITGLKTTLSGSGLNPLGNSYDTLRVDVIFAEDVSAAVPAPGSALVGPNQIGASVSLDIDGNPATGGGASCDSASSSKPFEYSSDQGNFPARLADGNYTILGNNGPIYSGPPNPSAEAVFSVSGNTLSYTFNLNILGGAKGTAVPKIGVNVAAFNGVNNGFFTDCVPTVNSQNVEVFTN